MIDSHDVARIVAALQRYGGGRELDASSILAAAELERIASSIAPAGDSVAWAEAWSIARTIARALVDESLCVDVRAAELAAADAAADAALAADSGAGAEAPRVRPGSIAAALYPDAPSGAEAARPRTVHTDALVRADHNRYGKCHGANVPCDTCAASAPAIDSEA
jgi:hypothetical protein